ncbi:uncharacterized protein B0I36DRAFT_314840 [Microdochium trichocladiopsis]|uniref:Uncharacterized protein n=1 Tax=Microdochium trichocladiopsis TaxID=1682393 RepID=A0A9P9BU72_9PEZI|nr:uncharacterized protein B0I36DRAFT_314840 [Microdochium trichocladiopsis]KAH7037797.1 hypothetical protein B0I36DRAFT_314840 [Microdochium trichocladiopsis]
MGSRARLVVSLPFLEGRLGSAACRIGAISPCSGTKLPSVPASIHQPLRCMLNYSIYEFLINAGDAVFHPCGHN